MNCRKFLTLSHVLALAVLPVAAALAQTAVEASIPSVNHGAALRDWEPDEDQGLWVEDANSKWYYASFTATCTALRLATNLNFDTGASDTLDRSSAILVPSGARCQLSSLIPSAGPDAAIAPVAAQDSASRP